MRATGDGGVVRFVLDGVRHRLDADSVRAALRGYSPDGVRTHWVDVDGTLTRRRRAVSGA